MSKEGATPSSSGKPKKIWKTPKIESFAVAGITESDNNASLNDGPSISASTS